MKPLTVPEPKPVPTPANGSRSRVIGKLREQAAAIFVHEKVLDQILDYSHRDLRRETGGFLLGGVYIDQRPYVEIREFVPASETRSGLSSLRFTHETWSDLNHRVQERFPRERVIGWHHTHPGLGVFLSSHDLFIHRNFFTQPWQVAMVVDPRARCFSLFQWQNERIVDCGFVVVAPSKSR